MLQYWLWLLQYLLFFTIIFLGLLEPDVITKILKYCIIFFIFCSFSIFIPKNGYSFPREKKKGPVYIFGDKVNIRTRPSLNGKVSFTLKIGDKVQIISKTKVMTRIGNTQDFWYKIKSSNKTGFIWGSLLADKYCMFKDNRILLVRNQTSGGYSKTATMEFGTQTEYPQSYDSTMEMRLIKNNKIITSFKTKNWLCEYTISSIHYKKFNQLEKGLFLLIFNSYSQCATSGKENKFFYINNKIKEVFSYKSHGEGGDETIETISYKKLKSSKKTALVVYYIAREYGSPNPTIHARRRIFYLWDTKKKRFNKYKTIHLKK